MTKVLVCSSNKKLTKELKERTAFYKDRITFCSKYEGLLGKIVLSTFGVLIIDIDTKGLDVQESVEAIFALNPNSKTILIASNSGKFKDILRLSHNVIEINEKPIEPNQLYQKILDILHHSSKTNY